MGPEGGRKGPNIFFSLCALIGGPVLVYYALQSAGWHPGVGLYLVWTRLSLGWRAITLAGCMATAYGIGGVLNAMVGNKKGGT